MPKFSILIPAYKTDYLKKAIDSIMAQTYKDFELVIVDDASPNDIRSVVSQYVDCRIRYYRNAHNCGAVNVVDNWNICLGYANGEYVICMGDDDLLLPDCLFEYNKLIAKYSGLSVFHAWTQIINENDEIITFQEQRPEWESAIAFLWHRWNRRNEQYIGDFLYKRSALIELGGFYKLPLAWASDDISAFRASIQNGIANTQSLCFAYRKNNNTITSKGSSKIKADATNLEMLWYKNKLSMIAPKTATELALYDNIVSNFDLHFRNRIYITIQEDLSNSISHFYYWIRYKRRYNLNAVQVVKQLYLNILNRMR